MKTSLILISAFLANICLCGFAPGDIVSIVSSKDNTLFEDAGGGLSNGAGDSIFVGRSGLLSNGQIKRGLLFFDVAAAVPSGATINDVTLTLNLAQTVAGNENVSLHPALADWGEGTSNSLGGNGAPATPGDATWLHTFFPGSLWASPGGDFNPVASATTSVGLPGFYNWNSATMVGDVQGWLNNPSSNFGWVVIGNEAILQTAKRFSSRDHPTATLRPMLTVDFTPIPEPSMLLFCGVVVMVLATPRRRFLQRKRT